MTDMRHIHYDHISFLHRFVWLLSSACEASVGEAFTPPRDIPRSFPLPASAHTIPCDSPLL